MEEMYERQLAEIVGGMPRRPCVVALVPTVPLDQAAALANDLAQSTGTSRAGHTLLTSLESAPARLDHEIGVEEGAGLTDVLSKRAEMREVAAQGRARRFIYVPAGAAAAPGASLLASPAWRALRQSATGGGGTVLAFMPSDVFTEVVTAWRAGGDGKLPFDRLVWLGPAGDPGADVRRAAEVTSLEIGSLQLPGEGPWVSEAAEVAERSASNGTPKSDRRATVGLARRGPRPSRHRIVTTPAAPVDRRQAARRLGRGSLYLLLLLFGVAGGVLIYFLATTPESGGRGVDISAPRAP